MQSHHWDTITVEMWLGWNTIMVINDQVEITRLRAKLEPTIKGSSGASEKAGQRRGKRRVVGASRGITWWVLCSLPGYWTEFGGCGKEQTMTMNHTHQTFQPRRQIIHPLHVVTVYWTLHPTHLLRLSRTPSSACGRHLRLSWLPCLPFSHPQHPHTFPRPWYPQRRHGILLCFKLHRRQRW
jgi:hypothetical protein